MLVEYVQCVFVRTWVIFLVTKFYLDASGERIHENSAPDFAYGNLLLQMGSLTSISIILLPLQPWSTMDFMSYFASGLASTLVLCIVAFV